MASVELTPVLIWYNATPDRVEARVRLYAGDIAIREESHIYSESELLALATGAGRSTWDESDLCALVPSVGTLWAGSPVGDSLRADIKLSSAEMVADIKTQIATLNGRLAALQAEG